MGEIILPVTQRLFHRPVLLVEHMLFLVLNGTQKRAGLIGGHLAIFPFLCFRCGGVGTLRLFFSTLLTASQRSLLLGGGRGCRRGLPALFCLLRLLLLGILLLLLALLLSLLVFLALLFLVATLSIFLGRS